MIIRHPNGRKIEVYDPMGKLWTVIDAMETGQQAQELALIILNAHKGYMPDSLDPFRMLCENHMDAHGGEKSWPCDEVRKLATVLEVSLG